jgi:hypothetical protein
MPPAASYIRRYDPGEIISLLSKINLYPADANECATGREIAAKLISPHVALTSTLQRVQARTQAAVFVYRQSSAITGLVAILSLRPQGVESVERHLFDPKTPPDDCLCRPGDAFAGLYGWGFSGSTRKAAALVLTGAIRLREHFSDIPFFTRAATAAGARALEGRMGYAPYPAAPDDLLWNPVRTNQECAA